MTERFGIVRLALVISAAVAIAAGCGGSSAPPAQRSAESEPAQSAASDLPEPESSATAVPDPTARPESGLNPPERVTIDDLLAAERTLNIAHAGGDQAAPHSTMFAFKTAVAAGADMLEIDVQLSADGEVVVHHDLTIDGTTNGTGPTIDFTLAELQALDNAYWFAQDCWPCRDLDDDAYLYRGVRTGDQPPPDGFSGDDFRIITLRELAAEFPTMPLDIEIKGEPPLAFETATALAELIDELELTESVVVVSFDDDVVAAFEAAAPDVETSPGLDEMTFWILADVPLDDHRIVQVPPVFESLEIVNAEFMITAAEAGVQVWVWPNDASTQENEAFYTRLIELGVDGVIAGRPGSMEAARS